MWLELLAPNIPANQFTSIILSNCQFWVNIESADTIIERKWHTTITGTRVWCAPLNRLKTCYQLSSFFTNSFVSKVQLKCQFQKDMVLINMISLARGKPNWIVLQTARIIYSHTFNKKQQNTVNKPGLLPLHWESTCTHIRSWCQVLFFSTDKCCYLLVTHHLVVAILIYYLPILLFKFLVTN